MSVQELFLRIRTALERAEVPYMLTGSFASAAHGTPRATQDIDIVIAPTPYQLRQLLHEFPTDRYYVSEDAATDALNRRSQFNIIDFATGWKVDFIIRKDRDFSLTEFERRAPLETSDVMLEVASAEDTLLSKLEWSKHGSSERQLDDAAGIIRMQGEKLDTHYVEHWVDRLDLDEQWTAALKKAGD